MTGSVTRDSKHNMTVAATHMSDLHLDGVHFTVWEFLLALQLLLEAECFMDWEQRPQIIRMYDSINP